MKKVIKYIAAALLIAVIAALVIRVIIANDRSVFDDFLITDAGRAAYAASGSLTVYERDLKDRISESGYFSAYSLYISEESEEVQVTVRYNVSAMKYTDTEFDEDLKFWLMIKGPDDESDEKASSHSGKQSDADVQKKKERRLDGFRGTYFAPASVDTVSRYGIYRYRKLIFEGVELSRSELDRLDVFVVMTTSDVDDPTVESSEATVDGDVGVVGYSDFLDRQHVHYAGQPADEYALSQRERDELGS